MDGFPQPTATLILLFSSIFFATNHVSRQSQTAADQLRYLRDLGVKNPNPVRLKGGGGGKPPYFWFREAGRVTSFSIIQLDPNANPQ